MLSAIAAGAMLAGSNGVAAQTADGRTELTLQGTTFHSTSKRVSQLRTFDLAGSAVVALWNEGEKELYAVSLNGASVQRVAEANNTLEFFYQPFDPETTLPDIPQMLRAKSESQLFVVQFETQSLSAYRKAIEAAGGEIVSYIPNNGHVVRMDAEAKAAVRALEFVRYVGNYDPAFRIDPAISARLVSGTQGTTRYSILLADKTPDNKAVASRKIEALGGVVNDATPGGRLMEATLTPEQLLEVANFDNVLWINLWGPYEPDMDIARVFHGTNTLETLSGFSGEGVIGMVRDTELRTTHQDFQLHPPIVIVNANNGLHGTACFGIVFGSGAGNASAKGVIPDAQGVFIGGLTTGATRFNQTQSAINTRHIVFETNSTGGPRTFFYLADSANMDDIIFDLNLLICQSQSNAGNQDSRPEAWAKNIVAVGGINHMNTVAVNDDNWSFSGSIGPASDGRIKPDLSSFYDNTLTTWGSSNNAYTIFGGTSGATPITAGHFGLLFQMWSEGVFNNTAYGTDVFSSKPNAMTAKAIMINTARQWAFVGTGADLTRVHQGWGHAQVDDMYNIRSKMFIVDQTDVLEELETTTYRLWVAPGEPAFKATLSYKDLPGNPAVQAQHRVNDLTLRVVSPGGTVYWGNNALTAGNWSVAGGAANIKDTVENVFVQSPASGVWIVEVSAPDINGDTHPQTVGVNDADYALVASGVTGAMSLPMVSETLETGIVFAGGVADTRLSENDKFSVRPGITFSAGEHPIRFVKEVQAPTTVGSLWVATEASVSDAGVSERVQLWNWTTSAWVTIGTHTDMATTDSVHTEFVGSPADYVNGSGNIRTRVSYYIDAPVFGFPVTANMDHVRIAFAP